MKVLISAYACDPTKGSENLRSWNWLLLHLRLGNEVWLFTSIWGKEAIDPYLAEMPKLHVVYVEVPEWVEALDRRRGVWHYVRYLYWQRKAGIVAKKLDKTVDFDLVHHISWGSIQQGSGMWRLNKRLLFGPVGGAQYAPDAFKQYFLDEWKSVELRRKTISDLLTRLNPDCARVLKTADLVWVANNETYALANKLGAKRVEYLTDTNLDPRTLPQVFPEREPHEHFKILWVGRMLTRKGLLLTFESLSLLDKSIPWTLTVVGDGDQGPLVNGWINELGIADRVNWVGQQPFTYVRQAYLEHDLFLFNSLRDSSADQFIESMSHGLPIVTLDLHGGKVIVPDYAGVKIPVETPDITRQKIADAIADLYYHPEKRDAMARRAYDYVTQEVFPQKEVALRNYLGIKEKV